MSSNSSNILHITSKIRKNIDSKRFLSKKLDWYSNGSRGHLHGTTRCMKMHKSQLTTVTHSLTLEKALERKICSDCYQRAFDTLFNNNTSDVISLIQIGDNLARFISNEDLENDKIDKIYDVVQNTRQYQRNLERLRDAVVESNFSKFYDKVQQEARNILERYLKALDIKKSDLILDITSKMLMPETTYGVDEINFNQEFYRLAVGEDRYQARQLSSIYTNWLVNLNKLSKPERLKSVINDSKSIKLSSIAQLVGLEFKSQHAPGSSILPSVEEDWRAEVNKNLEVLVESWEARSQSLFAKTDSKLIGIYLPGFRNEPYINLLIDVFRATPENKDTQIVILQAPEIVASYFLKIVEQSNRSGGRFSPVAVIDSDPSLDPISLLTATSLWTPDSNGVYHSFATAIKASATL